MKYEHTHKQHPMIEPVYAEIDEFTINASVFMDMSSIMH
jgi:hypothetical protein